VRHLKQVLCAGEDPRILDKKTVMPGPDEAREPGIFIQYCSAELSVATLD
jgi:hypothetical protein